MLACAFPLNIWGRQTPELSQPQSVAAPVVAGKPEDEDAKRRRETFEIVWQAVKDFHFDPRFGGVDWDAVKMEFAPEVAETESDGELHTLLQEMLNRLGQSHFVIIPPESIPSAADDEMDEAGEDEGTEEKSPRSGRANGAEVTERLTHGIGIDVRVINGAVVITDVAPSSTAARAGLRPGYVVRSVDGQSMRTALRALTRLGAYQPVALNQIPEELRVGFFNGPSGSAVRVSYLDARNRPRAVTIARERLEGEMSPPLQSIPSQFVRFESKRLKRGIGYIRFNFFVAPVLDKFCAALRSMSDAPGVIIDLRGNRGGALGMINGLGGLLELRDVSYGAMLMRAGRIGFSVYPQRTPYKGQLVVLIDSTTLSAGEVLAAGLQESGRAVIVGEKSAGATLPSVAKELPTGAVLQYAFADFVTARGNRLEGKGVIPNIHVRLDRRSLLAGRDPQLAAAVEAIQPNATLDSLMRTAAVAFGNLTRPAPRLAPGVARLGAGAEAGETPLALEPQAAKIIERYVQAIGGRTAVEKVTSRVSKGSFEGNFAGIKVGGVVEIYEKAPNKVVSLITVPETGVMRRGFTGAYGYEQVPLRGFREMSGIELDDFRLNADLHWSVKLPDLYRKIIFKGQEKDGDAEVSILEATARSGSVARLYFDVKTGLLTRRDDTRLEDYREVDGVLYPFTIKTEGTVFRLTEMKQNVAIDDARFAETKDCFTR